jgi:hypothetical protein
MTKFGKRDIEEKILKLKSREKASQKAYEKGEQTWWRWERQNPEPRRSNKAGYAQWIVRRRAALKKFQPADRDWAEVSCGPIALCRKAAKIDQDAHGSKVQGSYGTDGHQPRSARGKHRPRYPRVAHTGGGVNSIDRRPTKLQAKVSRERAAEREHESYYDITLIEARHPET